MGLSGEELKNLGYQELCNLLNNNPVLVARHLMYKFEVFIQKSYLIVHLAKNYNANRIKFQEKGIPHVHSFIWIYIENDKCLVARTFE